MAVHVIQWSKTLPDPDQFKHSVLISVIIHGSALALLSLVTYCLWIAIALCGNVAHQLLFKLTQWPISSGIVLPAIQKFPITVGFLLISLAHASCGGLALICAVLMYFMLLSKMYEDYLEEFVFKTAAVIAEKLFGRKPSAANTTTGGTAPKPAIAGNSTSQSKEENSGDNTQDAVNEEQTPDEAKCVRRKNKAKNNKKEDKKVEFDLRKITESNEQEETDDEATASKETKSKTDLEVRSDAVVAADSDESFEDLYNQLDPEDVAIFSRQDEVEEMTDEERQEAEKAEAG